MQSTCHLTARLGSKVATEETTNATRRRQQMRELHGQEAKESRPDGNYQESVADEEEEKGQT
jgi:hypothetical protein